jgi:hypothetical protein
MVVSRRQLVEAVLRCAPAAWALAALAGCGGAEHTSGTQVQFTEEQKAQMKSEAEETQAAVNARRAAARKGKG